MSDDTPKEGDIRECPLCPDKHPQIFSTREGWIHPGSYRSRYPKPPVTVDFSNLESLAATVVRLAQNPHPENAAWRAQLRITLESLSEYHPDWTAVNQRNVFNAGFDAGVEEAVAARGEMWTDTEKRNEAWERHLTKSTNT